LGDTRPSPLALADGAPLSLGWYPALPPGAGRRCSAVPWVIPGPSPLALADGAPLSLGW